MQCQCRSYICRQVDIFSTSLNAISVSVKCSTGHKKEIILEKGFVRPSSLYIHAYTNRCIHMCVVINYEFFYEDLFNTDLMLLTPFFFSLLIPRNLV